MSNAEEHVEEYQITLEEMQEMKEENLKFIEREESLQKLLKNRDFKKVFTEYYCKDYAVRLVSLLGDHSLNLSGKKNEEREELTEKMIGIARFQTFMRSVELLADQARKNLDNIEKAKEEYYETLNTSV